MPFLVAIILSTALTILIAAIIAATSRLLSILPPNRSKPEKRRRKRSFSVTGVPSKYNDNAPSSSKPVVPPYNHILIVLGSGGHTAEMLLMIQNLGLQKWRRRTWVVGKGDILSAQKAGTVEEAMFWKYGDGERRIGKWDLIPVPRARNIHQSLLTTPFSALQCWWACWDILMKWDAPDIVLTNGPGTGVIVVLTSLFLRFFDFRGVGPARTRVVYVESLARVRGLSLSGRLLKKVADRFVVQWEDLQTVGEYAGPVVLDAVMVQARAEAQLEEEEDDDDDDEKLERERRIRIEM
ncbi:glycosyltransferase family 1 protein [Venturia nashicola]|uniref:UDP-N-acetylglucosamine transferase subunit ALG14 n=1 Tax=Venturia nashicola TaxID=86259 RepID=A0A4Z1P4J2_9PEZI|nr:glycosyltransferase family 1 protein [Venturia nashicola]